MVNWLLMIGTVLVATIYNNVCIFPITLGASANLIVIDNISRKRLWSMRYVRHILRHLHGLTCRNVCLANQSILYLLPLVDNCLS